MIKVKLMADYHCYPLWGTDIGNIGNIDPESLPISKELVKYLNEWAYLYDSTLNINDPRESGFSTEKERQDFIDMGNDLFEKLKKELGDKYNIEYQY